MDEKDLEIARLRGQVEAYQDANRSLAIELLRLQVRELQDGETARDSLLQANQREFGKLKSEVDERLAKAWAAFVELRDQVKELRNGKPE